MLSEGRAVHGRRLVVFRAPGTGSYALVAGRKVGNAVQRNRARRVMRAAWREVASAADRRDDVVIVARATIAKATSPELVGEIEELLRR